MRGQRVGRQRETAQEQARQRETARASVRDLSAQAGGRDRRCRPGMQEGPTGAPAGQRQQRAAASQLPAPAAPLPHLHGRLHAGRGQVDDVAGRRQPAFDACPALHQGSGLDQLAVLRLQLAGHRAERVKQPGRLALRVEQGGSGTQWQASGQAARCGDCSRRRQRLEILRSCGSGGSPKLEGVRGCGVTGWWVVELNHLEVSSKLDWEQVLNGQALGRQVASDSTPALQQTRREAKSQALPS